MSQYVINKVGTVWDIASKAELIDWQDIQLRTLQFNKNAILKIITGTEIDKIE